VVPQAIFKSSKPPFLQRDICSLRNASQTRQFWPALLSEDPDTMATFMSWIGLEKRYSLKAGALHNPPFDRGQSSKDLMKNSTFVQLKLIKMSS
jgi:hypothetical protein